MGRGLGHQKRRRLIGREERDFPQVSRSPSPFSTSLSVAQAALAAPLRSSKALFSRCRSVDLGSRSKFHRCPSLSLPFLSFYLSLSCSLARSPRGSLNFAQSLFQVPFRNFRAFLATRVARFSFLSFSFFFFSSPSFPSFASPSKHQRFPTFFDPGPPAIPGRTFSSLTFFYTPFRLLSLFFSTPYRPSPVEPVNFSGKFPRVSTPPCSARVLVSVNVFENEGEEEEVDPVSFENA